MGGNPPPMYKGGVVVAVGALDFGEADPSLESGLLLRKKVENRCVSHISAKECVCVCGGWTS